MTTPFILPMHDRPHDFFRFTHHGLALLLQDFVAVQIAPRNTYFEAIDVLWLRILQERDGVARHLARFIIPIVFFLKRPLTILLGRAAQLDGITTGYVVSAAKPCSDGAHSGAAP